MAIAVPAYAEDAYVGVGPNGVGVGVRDHDHDRDWHRHYARDRDDVVIRHDRDCRTTVIHEGGVTKRIKRCRD
jgi:hypothetical protein